MRFLFTTIQSFESDFYGTVGEELASRGHAVAHVTVSHRSTRRLRGRGLTADCLKDLVSALPPFETDTEAGRIETQYGLTSLRDVYRADSPAGRLSEMANRRRAVEHFLALEGLFAEVDPDVLVPEVGTELLRTVAHHVALERGVPTFFLFYTIFPNPLRLYVDTMQGPIVPPDEVRELAPEEREEVERFVADFTTRREPIRAHRRVAPTLERLRHAAEFLRARAGEDRDNEYLLPGHWTAEHVTGWFRATAARPQYRAPRRGRPFVYFPLHDTEDYKIKQLIPHLADQEAIVELLVAALPPDHDLVVKEHPQSIGQNPVALLRRLAGREGVVLVDPRTSTHDLIERASALAVISSTVGLEGLLYGKPVLTLGRPFYAGQGLTVDVDSLLDLQRQLPRLLDFRPDRERTLQFLHAARARCLAGAPVLVDSSDENARVLASSIELSAERAGSPGGERVRALSTR